MTATNTDHQGPTFEPTFDEIAVLKHLEMRQSISVPEALHQHLPGRLAEGGYVTKTPQGQYTLTDAGRGLIRRVDA